LPDLRFSHLTERDGLSNNFVHAIVQDGDGLIWIATENGLNRFDGYGFKSFYANAADTQSVQNNRIQQLLADNKGRLWGTTTDGVFCFNIAEQHSFAWPPNPEDIKNMREDVRPYHIFLDSNQLPWASTYHSIVRDTAGRLWAATVNAICSLDPNTRDIIHTWQGPLNLLIRDLKFDSYHRCWVSTWGGMAPSRANPRASLPGASSSKSQPVCWRATSWA